MMNDFAAFEQAGSDLGTSGEERIAALLAIFSVPAQALRTAIAHPLAAEIDTLVVQDDLRTEDEEFSLVKLAVATGCDTVCILGDAEADGTGTLLAVQAGEDGAWIGYCRVFADSPAAQVCFVPLDPAHDLHLVMGVDGRLERRDGRPATHPAFGHRIAAARIRRISASLRDEQGGRLAA